MKKNLLSLTKNKYVFYVTCLLAILNVLGYFSMRSWNCIVMFAAVAYATNCYSNNKVIALLAGLFVSNFVFGCNQVKENFEEAMHPIEGMTERLEGLGEEIDGMASKCNEGETWDKTESKCKKAKALVKDTKLNVEKISELVGGLKEGNQMENIMSALTNMGK